MSSPALCVMAGRSVAEFVPDVVHGFTLVGDEPFEFLSGEESVSPLVPLYGVFPLRGLHHFGHDVLQYLLLFGVMPGAATIPRQLVKLMS